MSATRRSASWRTLIPLSIFALTAASCAGGSSDSAQSESPPDVSAAETETEAESAETVTLRIGAIPDQEPERLQRTYGLLSDFLQEELGDVAPGIEVEYVPVTEYESAVTGFAVGDLDTVWFGALTGVQARLSVDGANAIAQRDIDQEFTSVFIARSDAGIDPITDVALAWSEPLRIALVIAMLMPVGMVLGVFLPAGIDRASFLTADRDENQRGRFVAWCWAVNGFFSVIGSSVTTVASMTFGFDRTVLIGLVLYVVAIAALQNAGGVDPGSVDDVSNASDAGPVEQFDPLPV